jgi:hypothetical protein
VLSASTYNNYVLWTYHEPRSNCYEHVSLPLHHFSSFHGVAQELRALLVTSSLHSKVESSCTIETGRDNGETLAIEQLLLAPSHGAPIVV